MKETLLYEKFNNKRVRCNVCSHRCVMAPNERGICGVRENRDGKLYLLVYGKAIASASDPIEKKPFFHFLPKSKTYSFATVGCNFRCINCQNADISQAPKEGYYFENKKIPGEDMPPDKIVQAALKNNCKSISYTYTEPTIFLEYALDTMKLAREKGLKNCFVSNGYMTKEAAELTIPYLDAINIDLKSFNDDSYQKYCGASLEPVLSTLKLMKKKGVWLEVTTLLIPDFNDSHKELTRVVKFIKNELGEDVPWHVSRFYPAYGLAGIASTSVDKIHKACILGVKNGLKWVYAGNIPGDKDEDTYCHKCGELMIDRRGYEIKRLDKNGKCSKCKSSLDIIE
jgi:pyruvate formate lyase activating enzyme